MKIFPLTIYVLLKPFIQILPSDSKKSLWDSRTTATLTSFEKVKGGQGGTSTQSPTAQLAYHECTAGSTLQKMYCHANILQFLLLDLILLTFSTIKLVKRPFVAEESAMHM
jgi:hypothetical protein